MGRSGRSGRPRLEDSRRKDSRVNVRMTANELAALDELCVYCNCERASCIRLLITKMHDDIFGGETDASNS